MMDPASIAAIATAAGSCIASIITALHVQTSINKLKETIKSHSDLNEDVTGPKECECTSCCFSFKDNSGAKTIIKSDTKTQSAEVILLLSPVTM